MAALKILTWPNQILVTECETVKQDEFNEELQQQVADMAQTLYESEHGIGLAANQVGILKRIIVIQRTNGNKKDKSAKIMVMVNPVIAKKSGLSKDTEYCLSAPGVKKEKVRANKITVAFQDDLGNPTVLPFAGFAARLIQHELEHLNGITIAGGKAKLDKLQETA